METAAKIARIADRILSYVVGIILILFFLYGSYALWDTWQIYENAGVNEELLRYKPVLADSADDSSLAELTTINPDVRAWLTIDDTHIDYPLLQAEDNMKYINADVYGEFSLSGSLFLDYRNAADFSDFYSLIYGHHMDGDVMFGELPHFLDADYFDRHQTGTLFLTDERFSIELFACLSVDAYDAVVFSPSIGEEKEKQDFLNYLREEAVLYREPEMAEADRIIGLSTCSDAATNARIVVFGRLHPYQ